MGTLSRRSLIIASFKVSQLLKALYYKVDTLDSSLSLSQRNGMAERFRNMSSDVEVLLTTYPIGSQGKSRLLNPIALSNIYRYKPSHGVQISHLI